MDYPCNKPSNCETNYSWVRPMLVFKTARALFRKATEVLWAILLAWTGQTMPKEPLCVSINGTERWMNHRFKCVSTPLHHDKCWWDSRTCMNEVAIRTMCHWQMCGVEPSRACSWPMHSAALQQMQFHWQAQPMLIHHSIYVGKGTIGDLTFKVESVCFHCIAIASPKTNALLIMLSDKNKSISTCICLYCVISVPLHRNVQCLQCQSVLLFELFHSLRIWACTAA